MMIFNPLFFSFMNSKNSNDFSNPLLDKKNINSQDFPTDEIPNGFFQKIPKYLFSDIINVLLIKDEKFIPSAIKDKKLIKDVDYDDSAKALVYNSESSTKLDSNKKEISNKMDLVFSFINDLSLQNVFGSKTEEIKFALKESLLSNSKNEISIDTNMLKKFIEKLIINKGNEIEIVLQNNIKTNDNIKSSIKVNDKNSLNEKNEIANLNKTSSNLKQSIESNLLNYFNITNANSISLEKDTNLMKVIDLLNGGEIIIEDKNENKFVIDLEQSNYTDLNQANNFILKMNIVPNENILNTNDKIMEHPDSFGMEHSDFLGMEHSSGIDIFPLNEKDNFEQDYPFNTLVSPNNHSIYKVKFILNDLFDSQKTNENLNFLKSGNIEQQIKNEDKAFVYSSLKDKFTSINSEESVNNFFENLKQVDLENKINQPIDSDLYRNAKVDYREILKNIKYIPNEKNDNKIYSESKYIKNFKSVDDLKGNINKMEHLSVKGGLSMTENSNLDNELKTELNSKVSGTTFEKVNEIKFIDTNKYNINDKSVNENNVKKPLEEKSIGIEKDYSNEIHNDIKKNFVKDDYKQNNTLINKIFPSKENEIETKSDQNLFSKKNIQHLEKENIDNIHHSEEREVQAKMSLEEIKNDEDLSFINKDYNHKENTLNEVDSEKIFIKENNNEGINKDENNFKFSKTTLRNTIIIQNEKMNDHKNEQNEAHNKNNDSFIDSKQLIENKNNDSTEVATNVKEDIPLNINSEKISNQTKSDFVSTINSKENINSEINNFHKVEVNDKFFRAEKIIEISEVLKEVSSLISKKENGIIKLQIKPESLGKILITIDATKEIVNARIEVENKAVQALLENNINQLYSNLNQNGVQLSSVQIFLNQGESKNYKPNYFKKKSFEENNNFLNDEDEKITTRKLGYNTYEYLI